MNEVFSVARFGKLFVKHTVDHYRSYLMSIAVVAGVLVLGGSFISYFVMGLLDPGAQMVMYISLLTLAGTIFASTIFSDLGDKKKSIPTLLLPASSLEKFMVGWAYSYIVFIVLFTFMYYFALAAVIYFQSTHGHSEPMMVFFNMEMVLPFLLFSLLHSIALFGAICFEKLHFIKTAFAFFITFAVLTVFNTLLVKTFTGKDVFAMIPFSPMAFREADHFYAVKISYEKSAWILWTVVIVTVFFWMAAYFRLKEKRV